MISSLYISAKSKARLRSLAFSPLFIDEFYLRFNLNLSIIITFYYVYMNRRMIIRIEEKAKTKYLKYRRHDLILVYIPQS